MDKLLQIVDKAYKYSEETLARLKCMITLFKYFHARNQSMIVFDMGLQQEITDYQSMVGQSNDGDKATFFVNSNSTAGETGNGTAPNTYLLNSVVVEDEKDLLPKSPPKKSESVPHSGIQSLENTNKSDKSTKRESKPVDIKKRDSYLNFGMPASDSRSQTVKTPRASQELKKSVDKEEKKDKKQT